MMTPAPAAGGKYYEKEDNYYFLGSLENVWIGEGAKELGLTGTVDSVEFEKLQAGYLPDGQKLGKTVDGKNTHRPGYDLTFSAPKSVSILSLVGGDKSLLEAHNKAVEVAAGEVERLINVRVTEDKVTSIVNTSKMVAASYTHDTNRNHDPQLHTHLVVANMTVTEDGKWRALATDKINNAGFFELVMKHQVAIGNIYRTALKAEVERLGHRTEVVGENGLWEIKAVPKELRSAFSTRHNEIEEIAGDSATLKEKDLVSRDTRKGKTERDRVELLNEWLEKSKNVGFDINEYLASVQPKNKRDKTSDIQPEKNQAKSEVKELNEQGDKERPEKAITPDNQSGKSEKREPASVKDTPESGKTVINAALDNVSGNELSGNAPKEAKAEQEKPDSYKIETTKQYDNALNHNVSINDKEEINAYIHESVKQISNEKARFTYTELLSLAYANGGGNIEIRDVRDQINLAINDGVVIPLDKEKGVFTSQIHILDELSVHALSKDVMDTTRNMNIQKDKNNEALNNPMLEVNSLLIMDSSSNTKTRREQVSEIAGDVEKMGRTALVLASSVENMRSLKKDESLAVINKNMLLSGDFFLRDNSTVIVDNSEKLSLKEAVVLLSYAKESNSQVIFMDSEGMTGQGNALSAIRAAGVQTQKAEVEKEKIPTQIHSISDRRERFNAFAETYVDFKMVGEQVNAIITSKDDAKKVTGLIREKLQETGLISKEEITLESRVPVYLTIKSKASIASYSEGMIVEQPGESKGEKNTFTIHAVNSDTKKLVLMNEAGEKKVISPSEIGKNDRVFNVEKLAVSEGDELRVLAKDYKNKIETKSVVTVSKISDGKIEFTQGDKSFSVDRESPVHLEHAYINGLGAKHEDSGHVLAMLKRADLKTETVNTLAFSGDKIDIFTSEKEETAKTRLGKAENKNSPITYVNTLSEKENVSEKITDLISNVYSDNQKAVVFAIDQLQNKQIIFSSLDLNEMAIKFSNDVKGINQEIKNRVKSGELIQVMNAGEPIYVARSAYEMEKTIIKTIEEGKGAMPPLYPELTESDLVKMNPRLDLNKGQIDAAKLILTTTDQFINIQGYAGVGKTTMLETVIAAVNSMPEETRPKVVGLAPTHQAVKEMASKGVEAQTLKSFLMEGRKIENLNGDTFKNTLFVLDEISMVGNADAAEASVLISKGGGRNVGQGDISQLLSPEGSNPLKVIQERSAVRMAIMKEVVRQTDESLKAAVYDLIDRKPSDAIEKIASVQAPDSLKRGKGGFSPEQSVIDFANKDDVARLAKIGVINIIDAIAKDYAGRTKEVRDQTLILSHINKDRIEINTAVHEELKGRGALKGNEITIPILRRISDDRRELNHVGTYKSGLTLKISENYHQVLSVNKDDGIVTIKDAKGKISLFSPKENSNQDIALFQKDEINVMAGEKLMLTATNKEYGHLANSNLIVDRVDKNGQLHLKDENGKLKIINPKTDVADQMVDYAYAKTGYKHQGASSLFIIALEGVESGRKALATLRSFYVSASRAKEHVQVYADNFNKWLSTVSRDEKKITTVHDALDPKTEKQLASKLWNNASNIHQTTIGKAFLAQQSLHSSFAGKIIAPVKDSNDPRLAIPLYDGNGKFSGIATRFMNTKKGELVLAKEGRVIGNKDAEWSILKISKSGLTHTVLDLNTAFAVIKEKPNDGVILQLGNKEPTQWVFETSRGKGPKADEEKARLAEIEKQKIEAEKEKLKSIAGKINTEATEPVKGWSKSQISQAELVVNIAAMNIDRAVNKTAAQLSVERQNANQPTKPVDISRIELPEDKGQANLSRAVKEVAGEMLAVNRPIRSPADIVRNIQERTEQSIPNHVIDAVRQSATRTVNLEQVASQHARDIQLQKMEQQEKAMQPLQREQSMQRELEKDKNKDLGRSR